MYLYTLYIDQIVMKKKISKFTLTLFVATMMITPILYLNAKGVTCEIKQHTVILDLYAVIIENLGGPPVSKVSITVSGATITGYTDMLNWIEVQSSGTEITYTVISSSDAIKSKRWDGFGIHFSDDDFSIDWVAYHSNGKILGSGTATYP